MSTIRTTTLSTVDGTATVPVNTVVNGSAKAWVNFNGTGTVAIRAAFNVSSITDNGTGDYTVNFTTAMPNVNYAAVITGRRPSGSTDFPGFFTTTLNTGSMQMGVVQPGVSFYDSAEISVAIFR